MIRVLWRLAVLLLLAGCTSSPLDRLGALGARPTPEEIEALGRGLGYGAARAFIEANKEPAALPAAVLPAPALPQLPKPQP